MTYEIVRKELGNRQFAMKEDPRLRGEERDRKFLVVEFLSFFFLPVRFVR